MSVQVPSQAIICPSASRRGRVWPKHQRHEPSWALNRFRCGSRRPWPTSGPIPSGRGLRRRGGVQQVVPYVGAHAVGQGVAGEVNPPLVEMGVKPGVVGNPHQLRNHVGQEQELLGPHQPVVGRGHNHGGQRGNNPVASCTRKSPVGTTAAGSGATAGVVLTNKGRPKVRKKGLSAVELNFHARGEV